MGLATRQQRSSRGRVEFTSQSLVFGTDRANEFVAKKSRTGILPVYSETPVVETTNHAKLSEYEKETCTKKAEDWRPKGIAVTNVLADHCQAVPSEAT